MSAFKIRVAIAALRKELTAVAQASDADSMAAYMKNHFAFLGVKSPARNAVCRPWLKTLPVGKNVGEGYDTLEAVVSELWKQPEREFQYVAQEALWRFRKMIPETALGFLKKLIVTKSWWDTSDGLDQVVGYGVLQFPSWAKAMETWASDENMWVRRVCLQHQLGYDDEHIDQARLFRGILLNVNDTDFFIRKSIGWTLRQLAHYRPTVVKAFVKIHSDVLSGLSGLSKREALKHL